VRLGVLGGACMPDSLVPGTVSYYPNPRLFGNCLVGVGSEPSTFMSRTMVCNNGPYGEIDINLLGTLDSPLWEFNAYVRSSL
jgi:hypothetical protein